MKLNTLTESTAKWVDDEFTKIQERAFAAVIKELEASFEVEMKSHFSDFKLKKRVGEPQLLATPGEFTYCGFKFKTSFSTSGAILTGEVYNGETRVVIVRGGSVAGFIDSLLDKLTSMLTLKVLALKPESPSFRADYLKLQQDFVDRDLEIEIDHVPDQKTVITVESEDKKLRFKVKLK